MFDIAVYDWNYFVAFWDWQSTPGKKSIWLSVTMSASDSVKRYSSLKNVSLLFLSVKHGNKLLHPLRWSTLHEFVAKNAQNMAILLFSVIFR